MINSQSTIWGYSGDFLAEQRRIIDKHVEYRKNAHSDRWGYDCATFTSQPLQNISKKKGSRDFIKCETSVPAMLGNERNCFLFIGRLSDYSLSDLPNGMVLLRSNDFLSDMGGHAATIDHRDDLGNITLNEAVGEEEDITQKTGDEAWIRQYYNYFAWPAGLGLSE